MSLDGSVERVEPLRVGPVLHEDQGGVRAGRAVDVRRVNGKQVVERRRHNLELPAVHSGER